MNNTTDLNTKPMTVKQVAEYLQMEEHAVYRLASLAAEAVKHGGVALILIYLVVIYNNLVRVKHNVTKAWSNIDVLLKQRHDELPKLVEACKTALARVLGLIGVSSPETM